ncbi:hypothetical protein GJ744_001818 [Endocarpon pusillum]|uniref:Protein transport protein Sec61 subunit gamma n=1 Tax=Endocarpon pusillum TaxID=364733 RepID=A0A8H7AN25_9EURO|nr:hypothetical protein GJ744_001818 [Endocarpon pusillum]
MSETLQEIADVPKDFLRDGTQFLNRCTKPDKREFIKISQAVGFGFLIMGAIGYVIKLIHIPVNNILTLEGYHFYSGCECKHGLVRPETPHESSYRLVDGRLAMTAVVQSTRQNVMGSRVYSPDTATSSP